ncbi:glutamine amidotransferase-related protein [Scleromatobacter humisilvae]|uniref:Amidotransferase n=1 Tax=Scleromatobacter humisilvae TaxID=2897159 RepID=A0A9X2C2M3_9BURK|nr:amidotransferase [Scleromatobacter humisilvae]MCK9688846.1 amidotransferase [Scleromatobacter humisilvae]
MRSPIPDSTLNVCILDNDNLDPAVADTYVSYGAMTEKMFAAAGVPWRFERFNTTRGEYPDSFDAYDAVLLTGSKADSFSDEPWVRTLRERTTELLRQRKKLLGICFGHQLIAHCLGADVGRATQGWGMGRMNYEWLGATPLKPAAVDASLNLLASHQDQVRSLPEGATLLARSAFCPIAAYSVDDHVFCIQPHPEFVEDYSAWILSKRPESVSADRRASVRADMALPHDGLGVARFMRTFIEGAGT